jgi:hypothetical protein
MKNLQIVHDFFRGLKPTEKSILRNMLQLFDIEAGSKGNLSMVLFNLLKKNETLREDEYYIKSIYKKIDSKSKEAFRKLVERFRDKMYESLILDVGLGKPGVFVKVVQSQVEVRKNLAVILIVFIKGIPSIERKRILNRVIKICYDFELYDEVCIFLKMYLETIDIHEGKIKYQKRIDEIGTASELSSAILRSNHLVYLKIYDLQYQSYTKHEMANDILSSAEELKLVMEKYPSDNIKYNYYLLMAQYYHYNFDYLNAEKILTGMLDFIKNSLPVFTRNRIATCYMNLSFTKSYLYKFDEAVVDIIESREYYKYQNLTVQYYYQETEIELFIYTKKYELAQEVMDKVMQNPIIKESPLLDSKRAYLAATIKFLMKNYKASFKDLQDTKEIEEEKEGWNIGIRMLHIYLTLETEKVDLADQRIESLRKHIERTIKMKNIRKRDVVIFRILNQLARTGFNFKRVLKDRQKDFELLKSNEPDYKWMARSHELILFDQWFEAKAKGKPYDPVFPKPVEESVN